MNIYSIYKVTNKSNGKVYIGFASNLTKRKYRHKHYSLVKKVTNHFYTAIRKYGWNNFDWEIIYQTKDKQYCLNVMEKFFIEEYRSYIGFDDCFGYNMTLGGDGALGNHKPKTPEHKKRISQSHKGKKLSQEHILNAAYARSKEYKMISPSGNVIHIKNMSEYCRKHGLNQAHMISVCLGRYGFLSHKGYRKYE
jgi:group I intron endonuclease